MAEAKIRSTPDEELQYRSQEVKANNKTVVTPIKSIDTSKIHPTVSISKQVNCINELYSGLSKEKISNHMTGSDHNLIYHLNRIQKKFRNPAEELQFCFLEYKDESLPTQKEIEYMTDQAYVYSDITPLPMLSNFVDRITNVTVKANRKIHAPNDSKFHKVERYLKDSIETIGQLNNKPIMGYVPDFRYYFDKLIKIYADSGINTFYFDAHLSNPITLQGSLRAFMRELNKQGILEKSFIHLINPGIGRGIKDSSFIPAKDILGFGFGIDSLGDKHMRRVFNRAVLENMKKNPDNRSRLFSKKSYGYIKTSEKSEIKGFYPNDSGIDVSEFLISGKPDSKIQNAFNVEQLALESSNLRSYITQSRSILDYIDKKPNVRKDDVKILKRAKIKQRK